MDSTLPMAHCVNSLNSTCYRDCTDPAIASRRDCTALCFHWGRMTLVLFRTRPQSSIPLHSFHRGRASENLWVVRFRTVPFGNEYRVALFASIDQALLPIFQWIVSSTAPA